MSEPILRVRASGYGGSGYLIPTRTDRGGLRTSEKQKALKVPGVTTVLDVIDKPGLIHWHVANTAAYAVANANILAERDIDWGFRYLQYYTRRKIDYDDPLVDLHNYSTGVLNDLADTGTIIHEAIEAYVKDDYFGAPNFTRQEQVDAFECFLNWVDNNGIKFEHSEITVVNPDEGYAGTLDLVLKMDGKRYLVDVKTSKYPKDKDTGGIKPHGTHISQVAALANAPWKMNAELTQYKDTFEYKDLWWSEEEAPKYDGYAILQVRPTSIDDYGEEIPAFCLFHEIDERLMEPAYDQFLGALKIRKAQVNMKHIYKVIDKEELLPWD